MSTSKKSSLFRASLIIFLMLGLFNAFHQAHASSSWSSPILVDTHRGIDYFPSALQAKNGTIWLAWESTRNSLFVYRPDIIYKTYTNGVWSSDHNLTTSGANSAPSLVQLSNGTILIFWAVKTGSSFIVVSSLTNGASWSNPVQITSTTLNDTQPSATVGPDGTIWLVWTRINSSTNPADEQLYYKTWKAGAWSPETKLTSDSNQNYGSSVVVGKDGIVRVTWAKGTTSSNYQLFDKTYNGTAWTPDAQIVSSSSTDDHPSMIQDRNGTLWLFWDRLIVVSLTVQFYELVGKFSYDLGKTWSPETALTNTANTVDSEMPSAVQSNTGVDPIWLFYSSDLNVPDLDIYALQSSGIYPVHDVNIPGLYGSNYLQYPGGLKEVGQSAVVTITVKVVNIGDYVETVSITLTATNKTSITVGTKTGLVGPGNTLNLLFFWNTTGVTPARYGFSASISALPGETIGNMPDNSLSVTNQIHIIPQGDVNQDGSVTIVDIAIADFGYNAAPGNPRWNPYADWDNDNVISIVDIAFIMLRYGTTS